MENLVKGFELARCKYTVNIVEFLYDESFGTTNYDNVITVSQFSNNNKLNDDSISNSIYYQIVNNLFIALGRKDISRNCIAIKCFANALREFDLTKVLYTDMTNFPMVKSFELSKMLYTVNLVNSSDGVCAQYFNNHTIEISRKIQSRRVPLDAMLNSFYHELVHAIFFVSGHNLLSEDEVLVQSIANLLMEFEMTKKYDKDIIAYKGSDIDKELGYLVKETKGIHINRPVEVCDDFEPSSSLIVGTKGNMSTRDHTEYLKRFRDELTEPH